MGADINKTIAVSVTATTRGLDRALKKIPDNTERNFAKAAKKIDQEMKKAEKSAEKAAKKAGNAWKDFGSGMAKLGASMGAVGVGVVMVGQHFADLTNELSDASAKSGIASSTLGGLRLALEGSGRALSEVEPGLLKFNQSIVKAGAGTGKQAEAFAQMGVSLRDTSGQLRSTDDIFNDVIDALGKMEGGTAKNASMMNLFGASAAGALIQSGALDAMDEFVDLSQQFGVDTGPSAAAAAAQFQRNMASLKSTSEGAFQGVLDALAGGGSSGQGLNMLLEGATKGVIYFSTIAQDSIGLVSQTFEDMVGVVGAASMALGGDFEGAKTVLRDLSSETMTAFDNAANTLDRASEKVDEYEKATAATAAAAKKAGEAQTKSFSVAEKQSKEAKEAAKEEEKRRKELEAAEKALEATRRSANDVFLGSQEKIIQKYDDELRKIDELTGKGLERADLEAARAEVIAARDLELFIMQKENELEIRQIRDENAKRREEQQKKQIENIQTLASLSVSSFSSASDSITAIAQNQGKVSAETAKKLHKMQKTAGIAEVGVNTAVAIMKAYAQFGFPLAIPAIGVISAASGLQIAAIASQPTPEFHQGGMVGNRDPVRPDEQNIRALSGEYVLSRDQVARMGGVRGIEGGKTEVIVMNPFKHLDRYNRSAMRSRSGAFRTMKPSRRMGY